MCSHKVRFQYSNDDLLFNLTQWSSFKGKKIVYHSDETHAYIMKNRDNILNIIKNDIVRSFRMYSASPLKIWL